MDHVQHAPLAQDHRDVKTVGLSVREGLAAPALQVKAQVGFFVQAQGVVLEDCHGLTLFGEQGFSFVVVSMQLPAKHDLAQVLDLAEVLGFLGSQINNAVAPRDMGAGRDGDKGGSGRVSIDVKITH